MPRGLQVLADPLAVDVVVRNLLENAMAAVAPVGGGTITLARAAVKRRSRADHPRQRRRLSSQVDSARLFKKFSRLHPGGGSSHYGHGLGLFIVRRLMQLAGGACQRAQRRCGAGRSVRAHVADGAGGKRVTTFRKPCAPCWSSRTTRI